MKRLMIMLLVAAVLCGCSSQSAEPPGGTTQPTQASTVAAVPTEPAGFYVPESELEITTQGGVRVYIPEDSSCYAIEVLDGDVLLFTGGQTTTLTRLTGDNLYPIAQAQLACYVYPEDASFCFSDKGITYYDEAAGALVFLDNDLKEVNRVKTPEGILGTPVLSANRLKLYYCTADAVRVLDLETGLDRLLKQMNYSHQSVGSTLFHDTVLQCHIFDGDGYTLLISAETGELLELPQQSVQVTGAADRFYALLDEGHMQEILFGTGREDTQMLTAADPFGTPWCLEDDDAVVMTYSTEASTSFAYYELETGFRRSMLELPVVFYPWCVEACPEKAAVYLIGYDQGRDGPAIYRWDLASTAINDGTVYTGPWYTLDSPDLTGLAECAQQAQMLGQAHGLNILVGPEAAALEPWDYEIEPEYQVPVIRRDLEKLEQYLTIFPEGFFETVDEDITICLVRGLYGSAESGSLDSADGIQFWDAGKAYVALVEGNNLEMTLYHELFHIIDNHVLSACNAYYDWERLNPQGFAYDLDYIANQSRDPEQYLEEGTRAFIDTYSMSFPKEDRARIMEYASTPGHESYFQSETMQTKLRTLCQGIRTAFWLKDYPNAFIWEQYLATPLTK